MWLSASTVSVLLFRKLSFRNLVAISNTCALGTVTQMDRDKVL